MHVTRICMYVLGALWFADAPILEGRARVVVRVSQRGIWPYNYRAIGRGQQEMGGGGGEGEVFIIIPTLPLEFERFESSLAHPADPRSLVENYLLSLLIQIQ